MLKLGYFDICLLGYPSNLLHALMSDCQILCGIDIGGSLIKCLCIVQGNSWDSSQFASSLAKYGDKAGSDFPTLSFIHSVGQFTGSIENKTFLFSLSSRVHGEVAEFIRILSDAIRPCLMRSDVPSVRVGVTGGGGTKYREMLDSAFDFSRIVYIEEMEAVAGGVSVALSMEGYDTNADFKLNGFESSWLLVNAGSGVSMLKLDRVSCVAKRVFGSPLGGGTLLGLARCLFPEFESSVSGSYERLIELSASGESSRIDFSLKDLEIATDHALSVDWDPNTLAISFAKQLLGDESRQVCGVDVAQSLVRMISYNMGNIACLVADLNGCSTLVFSGKFVNRHQPTVEAITKAIRFYEKWSSKDLGARKYNLVFLKHDGFVGCFGVLKQLK